MAVNTEVTASFPGLILLAPGSYVFVINEPIQPTGSEFTGNVMIANTNERFTTGTTWINWPTNPLGDWANNEDFAFNSPYLIRPIFILAESLFEDGFESP